jgi:hypothetical protein
MIPICAHHQQKSGPVRLSTVLLIKLATLREPATHDRDLLKSAESKYQLRRCRCRDEQFCVEILSGPVRHVKLTVKN